MATKEGQQYISSNFKYKWNTDDEEDTVGADIEESVEALTAGNNNDVYQSDTPLEFHEIADEVNEIIMDTETTVVEENNPSGDQAPNRVTEVPNVDANPDDEQIPEQIQSTNIDISTTEPESENVNVDSASTGDDSKEETHSDGKAIADEANAEQSDDEASDMEPEGRYNLCARTNVNYKHMHKYGETQLMQIHQNWINDRMKSTTTDGNSRQLIMNTKDLYRRIVGTTMTQMAKSDKYA